VTPAALTLVPTWRLGSLLETARLDAGRSLDDLASASDRFDVDALAALERGERPLTDAELSQVIALYGVDADELLPGRTDLVVDLDQSRLATAGHTQPLAGAAPSADEVLAAYLALICTLRSTEPGTRLPLRDADLEVLALALALANSEVERRLLALMSDPSAEVTARSRLLRARVLVPAAGVLVAVTVAGALVVSARSTSSTPTPPPPAAVVPSGSVDIGAASTQGRDGSGEPQPQVVQGEGLTADQIPAGAVGLGDAQVAVRDPAGNAVQGPRTDDPSTASSTTSSP
jgi:hypothetical protein